MRRVYIAAAYVLAALAVPAVGQTRVDLKSQAKNVDFTSAASTKPFRTGTELPAGCSLGEVFFKTNATAGRNWYACTAENTWTLQSGGVPDATGSAGRVLASDGTAAVWVQPGGDVTGAPDAAVVERIRGRRVADATPAEGQVLRWNATSEQWEPQAVAEGGSGPASANVSYAFTAQTTLVIPGSTHGLATANLLVSCYDEGGAQVEPDSVTVDAGTYAVTVRFATPQSGRCVINGSGGGGAGISALASNTFAGGTTQTFLGALVATSADRTAPAKSGTVLPATCTVGDQFFKTDASAGQNLHFCTATNVWTQMSGGGGGVESVFGRSGAVTAQAGDYSFAQIAGTVTDAQIAPGLNAAKIGSGSVTNTAFGYLSNVTSDLQSQLNSKAAAEHGHAVAGDVTGDLSGTKVTRIQGRQVAATAPADGQGLVWSAANNTWQPGTVSGGGGGMASLLGDFQVTRTTATTLSIGANCSTSTPCNARFGNIVYTFTRGCTATLSAGTGSAYVYITSGGVLTVGHNMTLSASPGCMAQPSVTSFPADSIPLYTWAATSGTWDESGGHDFRAVFGQKGVTAGTGIATVENGGRTTVSVDAAVVPMYLSSAATINFPLIAAGTCSADYTITVTGAVLGDAVAPGWPGGMDAGLIGMMRVSAANTVAVRLCNLSASAIDPVSASYRATIVRSF
ncbi:MAG: hypothetical protein ACM3ZB_13160 [bacterium]|jgi:hypothetical protein